MALRDIAVELLRELEDCGESEAYRSLQENLLNVMEVYYGGKNESERAGDDLLRVDQEGTAPNDSIQWHPRLFT